MLRNQSPGVRGWYVDIEKPGAEEWVKGQIRYYISLGIYGIQTDFHTNLSSKTYQTIARWISEAAGDDLLIWYLMNSGKNNSSSELDYVDIRRINGDGAGASSKKNGYLYGGGNYKLWDYKPENEGASTHRWSWNKNVWDGFTFFSDFTGRGVVVNDGDAVMLKREDNNVKLNAKIDSAEGHRRKQTIISLWTMAGSPINVAEVHDSIGQNLSYYRNPEMLNLSKRGFVGKAMGRHPEPLCSQRWAGQLSTGEWVVALFNRADTPQSRSIDISADLGIDSVVSAKDLWNHKALDLAGQLEVQLEKNGAKVVKIIPHKMKFQAEVASFFNQALMKKDHQRT